MNDEWHEPALQEGLRGNALFYVLLGFWNLVQHHPALGILGLLLAAENLISLQARRGRGPTFLVGQMFLPLYVLITMGAIFGPLG